MPSASGPTAKTRTIFVAYPWSLYDDRKAYKAAFETLQKPLDVKFRFAEERITTGHVLDKIITMIRETDFGVYDVSGWNPNVTLEYGAARGMGAVTFIAFNPDKTDRGVVPSDVAGYDRMQYRELEELSRLVAVLVVQELGEPPTPPAEPAVKSADMAQTQEPKRHPASEPSRVTTAQVRRWAADQGVGLGGDRQRAQLQQLLTEGVAIRERLFEPGLSGSIRRLGHVKPANEEDVKGWEARVGEALSKAPRMRASFDQEPPSPDLMSFAIRSFQAPLQSRMEFKLQRLEAIINGTY